MSDNDGYYGQKKPNDSTGEYNAQLFLIRQVLDTRNHVAVVKVVAVNAPLGLALAGTVDVQPLVNQLDGQGNAVPHGVINNLPYFRAQGGANAVIIDPEVGDLGVAVICDRDTSAVQETKGAANPGSKRRNDWADGIYFGGLLNGIPEQYMLFQASGIKIFSPTKILLESQEIELKAPVVKINASSSTTITTPTLQLNGSMTATGNITTPNVIFAGGKSLAAHTHGGVQTGGGTTGGPS